MSHLLSRKAASHAEAYLLTNHRDARDLANGRKHALNELRRICEEDPELILEFEGDGLDTETRHLLERLRIIAMKQQGRRQTYQS